MKNRIYLILLLILMINCNSKNTTQSYIKVKFNGFVSGQNVNVRENPSLESKIIGNAFLGTKVYVRKRTEKKMKIGEFNDYWYFCKNFTGEKGWIYGKFIKNGEYDFKSYINKLPNKLLPESYKKLEAGWWTSCGIKEWKEEPSCKDSGTFFTKKIIYFGAGRIGKPIRKINYLTDVIYEISDYKKESNRTTIYANILFCSDTWELNNDLNKLKVVLYTDKKMILINDQYHYNAYSYK